jgi:CHAT domain-containing protein
MKKTLTIFIIFLTFFDLDAEGAGYFNSIPNDTTRSEADSIMKAIHLKAFEERNLGRYENAEKLYKEVVRLKETYAPDDTLRLGNVYGNYANILSSIWKFDEALSYYDRALEMTDGRDKDSYMLLLMNKGSLLLNLNDVASALNYYEQVEKKVINDKSIDSVLLKNIYTNKTAAYFSLNKYSEALAYINLIKNLGGLSTIESYEIKLKELYIYFLTGENKKAMDLYNGLINKHLPNDIRHKFQSQYGSFLYSNLYKTDESIELYRSMEKNMNVTSISIPDKLSVYNNLGNCYELKKMYKEALENYQKALKTVYPDFNNENVKSSPQASSLYEEFQNLTVFKNKAEVLLKYSRYTNDTSYLTASLENCMRSINIIQKMRYRVTSDQSQFLISKKEKSAFNLAQYVALEKYSKTNDVKFLNLAFEVNEEGRAFTLLSAMRNQKAMDFGDIPLKIRKQESELNRQLSLYDELLYKEKQMAEPDLVKISNWEDQLFNVNEDYTKLLRKLEREYPEYYRLKFDEEVTDLFDIQKKIDKNTILVEYSYMDSVLIIYTASRDKIAAKVINLQPGFEDKCIEFLNLITTQNFSNNANETYLRYISLAHEIYSIVIEPVKDQLAGENLIVIPDGAISYLPFDALLTSEVPRGMPDYRHIPYLVKDYSVGYSYSTTIHFNPLQHVRIPSQSILAFAPVYTKVPSESANFTHMRNQKYLDLDNLPGVTIEVKRISEMLKTDAYYNVSAKESVFKEMAGRYNIIHLAMHTMIDNNDPMLSKLIFTQVPDGEDDGLLHTYEIYNMKLNASMTVLSSCSSGYGKIQPGEGVQSLARGFAYAGCPSILMTLWEVGDLSTVLVMTDFYKFLKEHRTKPQALRESKLAFLNGADQLRSNPFFWASYVIIGDSSPLYPFRKDMAALSAIMLVLPLGFLRVYYKKYKKKEQINKRKTA